MKYNNTGIIFYSSPEGGIRVEGFYEDDIFWLIQKRIVELYVLEELESQGFQYPNGPTIANDDDLQYVYNAA